MAGTVTVTPPSYPTGRVYKITFSFTSNSSGNADGTTTNPVNGRIHRVVTNPGSAAPTADWDLTITDEDGVDILAGAGADRHTTNSLQITPSVPIAVSGPLTINVTNAGDTKTGTVVLYVEKM